MSWPETTDFLARSPFDIVRRGTSKHTQHQGIPNPLCIDFPRYKPVLKTIGSTKIVYYEVVTSTDFDGFNPRTAVQRRYSEFQALRKTLVAKGAKPPSLSWFEWIPKNRSRWEEVDEWVQSIGTVSYDNYNEDCLRELKRFFDNKSPYQLEKLPSFMDRLFK